MHMNITHTHEYVLVKRILIGLVRIQQGCVPDLKFADQGFQTLNMYPTKSGMLAQNEYSGPPRCAQIWAGLDLSPQ